VEWEGGIGYADRDTQTPVTADTHFRVGSISKTFVAMALVQLSEDGLVDLDSPVADIEPSVAIDNPWHDSDPVRVIHVLQHTAGFDDMHFNELFVADNDPEPSQADVLARNPSSRRVRWRPGTRYSYSNPGYAVAALLIEKVTGEPYEDYIKREIFDPLQMTTSSFRLTADDEAVLARGYDDPSGPPVGLQRIYLRPSGNMHSSPRELGRFVRMLLGWGELGSAFVIDPEYLGSMEQPRTTLASAAGIRDGYGSGIFSMIDQPYHVLGHSGGISGFSSFFAYSSARDAGYVILLNSRSDGAAQAVRRLSSLALGYLKRDVEPPPRPEIEIDAASFDRFAGYYHEANPRNQWMWAVQWLFMGRTIVRDGNAIYEVPVFGGRERLIPTGHATFRLTRELGASRAFTHDADGHQVLAGGTLYAERRPRWRVEAVRVSALIAIAMTLSVFPGAIIWLIRRKRARPRRFWGLKLTLLLCPIALLIPVALVTFGSVAEWGTRNATSIALFLATLVLPFLAVLVAAFTAYAYRLDASRWLTAYALVVAVSMAGLSGYLASHGLLGLRTWTY
jgi:CubicO group peptidase (beta-lactamase class C family)